QVTAVLRLPAEERKRSLPKNHPVEAKRKAAEKAAVKRHQQATSMLKDLPATTVRPVMVRISPAAWDQRLQVQASMKVNSLMLSETAGGQCRHSARIRLLMKI